MSFEGSALPSPRPRIPLLFRSGYLDEVYAHYVERLSHTIRASPRHGLSARRREHGELVLAVLRMPPFCNVYESVASCSAQRVRYRRR